MQTDTPNQRTGSRGPAARLRSQILTSGESESPRESQRIPENPKVPISRPTFHYKAQLAKGKRALLNQRAKCIQSSADPSPNRALLFVCLGCLSARISGEQWTQWVLKTPNNKSNLFIIIYESVQKYATLVKKRKIVPSLLNSLKKKGSPKSI